MKEVIPTLFVGLGGTGHIFVSSVKETIQQLYLNGEDRLFPLCRYLVADTEFASVPPRDGVVSPEELDLMRETWSVGDEVSPAARVESQIIQEETVDLRVSVAELIRRFSDPETTCKRMLDFLPSKDELSLIEPAGFGASQIPLVGKMMGAIKFTEIYDRLETELGYLNSTKLNTELEQPPWHGQFKKHRWAQINVYIGCSLGGGTGRGLHLTVAQMVRFIVGKFGSEWREKTKIMLVNFSSACFDMEGRAVPTESMNTNLALQYAGYKEVEHTLLSKAGNIPGQVEAEQFFRNTVGAAESEELNLKVYDTVFIVDPRIDNHQQEKIPNYRTLNDLVAQAIANGVFDGHQGAMDGDLSNKGEHILEAATNQRRSKNYGRIGRAALRYPVQRLERYLECFIKRECLLDLTDGRIAPGGLLQEPPKVREEHALTMAQRLVAEKNSALEQAFPLANAGLEYSQINPKNTWDGKPHFAAASKFKNARARQRDMCLASRKRLVGAEDYIPQPVLTVFMAQKDKDIQRWVDRFGMKRALDILDQVTSQIDRTLETVAVSVRNELGIGVENELNEFGEPDPHRDKSWNQLQALLYAKAEEIETAGDQFVSATGAALAKAVENLKADEESWERKRGLFRKFAEAVEAIDRIPKDTSANTQNAFDAASRDFQKKVLKPLRTALRAEAIIAFWLETKALFQTRKDNLRANIEVIFGAPDQVGRMGLARVYNDETVAVAGEPIDPTEVFIDGQSWDQCERWCRRFSGTWAILEHTERYLRKRIVPYLSQKRVMHEQFSAELDAVVPGLVEKAVESESICKYLSRLHHKTREGRWRDLHASASHLGRIDTTKVDLSHADKKSGAQWVFMEMADPTLFTNSVYKKKKLKNLVPAQRWHREHIYMTLFNLKLPLFVFESARETLPKFEAHVSNSSGTFEQALAKLHTSTKYFYAGAPLIQMASMSRNDFESLFNLMLHLGVVRVGTGGPAVKGVLECYHRTRLGWRMEPYRDPNNPVIGTVKVAQFLERPDPRITNLLLTATVNALAQLASAPLNARLSPNQKIEAGEHLEAYINDTTYPRLPRTLLEQHIHAQGGADLLLLKQTLENFESELKKKEQTLAATGKLELEALHSTEELHRYFADPAPVHDLTRSIMELETEDTEESQGESPDTTDTGPPPLPGGKSYYYVLDGAQTGPVRVDEMEDLIETSVVDEDTHVWWQGQEGWMQAKQCPDLAELLEAHRAATSASPPPLPGQAQFLYQVAPEEHAQATLQELERLAQSGQLGPETLVWKEGLTGWVKASTVDSLASLFQLSGPPPIPSPSADVVPPLPTKD